MKVLFDQGVPEPLRQYLEHHEVATAYEQGWATLKNSVLLSEAEQNGFHIFVTTDTNLKHQQDLSKRRLGFVVLRTTSWPRIQRAVESIVEAIDTATPGSCREVQIP